jgi:hypothetical protein
MARHKRPDDSGRRTLRSIVQFALTLAAGMPVIIAGLGVDPASTPGVASLLAVSAGVVRVFNSPVVDARLPPWLKKAPEGTK